MPEESIPEPEYYRDPKLDLDGICKYCGEVRSADGFKYEVRYYTTRNRSEWYRNPKCRECVNLDQNRYHASKSNGPRVYALKPDCVLKEKPCTRCGAIKPVCEFQLKIFKRKTGPDRKVPSPWCLSCKSAVTLAYIRREHEIVAAKNKAWKRANADRINAGNRERRKSDPEHREHRNAVERLWAAKNFESGITKRMQEREARIARRLGKPRRKASKRHPELRKIVRDVFESYRIGELYWDVYDSCLIEKPTIDHIIPLVGGGYNEFENLTITSLRNNSSKRNTPLIVWMAQRAALGKALGTQPTRDRTSPELAVEEPPVSDVARGGSA